MDFNFLRELDVLVWIIAFIGAGLFYSLYNILSNERWYQILLGCRVIIFIILGLMLLNPIVSLSSEKEKKLEWAIFVDNSASIKYHQTPSLNAIQSGIQSFVNSLSEKNISYNLYEFSNEIRNVDLPSLKGDGVTTNLGIVSKKIKKDENDLAGVVIISDGLITEGKDPIEEFKNINIPVFTLGIGEGSELVDVAIKSIDVPTVVLKSDGVNVRVTIQSVGNITDRLSVSLYKNRLLLGSKYIRLYGQGSKKEVNFQFHPNEIGKQNFEVRVSSVEDEINIQNNRQNFNLLVLKDRYKVALLTGSPNKNTAVLKRALKQNTRIELDHFTRMSEKHFRPTIKSFWEKPYELIIFDNYPIKPLSSDFVRILGKKVLANQAALMLFSGPNQSNASLKGIASILGVSTVDSVFETKPGYWDFIHEQNFNEFDQPPLSQNIFISGRSNTSDTLAISESNWPLWVRNENGNIRTMIWTSPEIYFLYFHDQKRQKNGLFSAFWNQSISWLLKTEGEHENFFRLNKDRFQQGEMVQVTGTQPFDQKAGEANNIIITVYKDSSSIVSRDISFNIEEQRWIGEFRAPGPGVYKYSVQLDSGHDPIQSGEFQVLESQIELNQVHLNKKLLTSISNNSNGQFFNWTSRDSLLNEINPKVHREFKAEIIKFTESKILLFVIVILLCIEWFIRRKRGLS